MTRRRPTVILVVGIFNLILAGLGVLSLLCFGALVTFVGAFIGFFSLKRGDLLPPPFKLNYLFFNGGLVLLTSALLLISGIGLLRMKPWARWASVISGAILTLMPVGGLVFNIVYFNPAMEQWSRVNPQQQQWAQEPEFNPMISVCGLVPGMAYGLMLLVVMFLPNVSAYFAKGRLPSPGRTS
jgi:hypothetical protein